MLSAFAYIMSNHKRGTLYTGVTTELPARVYQHKHNIVPGYTSRYALHLLAYFEAHDDIREAIAREKRIKRWPRKWKIELVESRTRNGAIFTSIFSSFSFPRHPGRPQADPGSPANGLREAAR